jgi:hypothetical protein
VRSAPTCCAKLAGGRALFPGVLGYERTVIPGVVNACSPATTSSSSACAARPRRASCARSPTSSIPRSRCSPAASSTTTRWRRSRPGPSAARRSRRRRPRRVAAARGALQREARHAGRLDRRPPGRHRSDQGGHAQADLRRPRGHPLRHHPAHQPRHLRHQRAARPGAAHPGRPAQHPRGARPPDPRLPGAHPARSAARLLRQSRGLHQPRHDHHAAQGPHLFADPHPLPSDARARGADHRPGGVGRARRSRSWCPTPCACWSRRSRSPRATATSSTSPPGCPRGWRSRRSSSWSRTSSAGACSPATTRSPASATCRCSLPAITGKVEMVYEGSSRGPKWSCAS